MAYNKVGFDVNVRGADMVLKKLAAKGQKLNDAQRKIAIKYGKLFREEAKKIISDKAPKSSGKLKDSIYYTVNTIGDRWTTLITTDLPYAKKVESGRPMEVVPVRKELLNWVKRVLGDGAYDYWKYRTNARNFTVGKGNNPRYNTRIGMRFFQTPFRNYKQSINNDFQSAVKRILSSR